MANYADIAELDQVAFDIRNAWNVTMKHAASFAARFRSAQEHFQSGKFGPEWTFSRWLIAKCGMSEKTSYSVIKELERTATDDDRRRTDERLAEIRKEEARDKTDFRARKLAWNDWLLEEKFRTSATQTAWDEWLSDSKATQTAWDEWLATEKRKEAKRKRNREYYRLKKAEKSNADNALWIQPPIGAETEKALSSNAPVATVSLEMVLAELVAVISTLPKADRLPAIRQVVGVLHELCDDIIGASGEATGWVAAGIDIRH